MLVSALSLLLCVSMLAGSTFDWFTDSVTSRNNVITSGNLDIEVQYSLDGITWNDLEGAKDLFQKDLWEPGHTEVVALKLTNKGSLAFSRENGVAYETTAPFASKNLLKKDVQLAPGDEHYVILNTTIFIF